MPVDRVRLAGRSWRQLAIGLSHNSTVRTVLVCLIIQDYVNQADRHESCHQRTATRSTIGASRLLGPRSLPARHVVSSPQSSPCTALHTPALSAGGGGGGAPLLALRLSMNFFATNFFVRALH